MIRRALRRLRLRLLPVPGQALGLAVLVAVLAAALVSAPLMIASADQGAWEQQQDRFSRTALGTTVLGSTYTGDGASPLIRIDRLDDLDAAVRQTADDAGLSAPLLLTRPRFSAPALTPPGPEPAVLVHRSGAEDHLELVDGDASGVLIPEALAEESGVRPGGVLTLQADDGTLLPLTVSGVYVTPTEPVPEWWEAQDYLFLPRYDPDVLDVVPPPAAIFAPRDRALAGYTALREDAFFEWFLPPEHVDAAGARVTADRIAEFQLRLTNPDSPVASLVAAQNFSNLLPRTELPDAIATVDRTVELLAPPVRAVGIGGGAAALVLVGAWTGLRLRRREDEVRSLMARGLSPARGAMDAVREALLPLLLGLAIGGLVGWLLVRALGPSPNLADDAVGRAGLYLLGGGLAVLLVAAAVTAVLVTRLDDVGRNQAGRLLGRIPWLAVTAVVAVLTAVPLVTGADDGGRLGVLPLLLPLLVTVVAAGAVTSLLPRAGRAVNGRRLSPAGFLAVRRFLAGQGATRLVVVTTALALGLVVQAGALADSTDRTIAAKASVATGSDVVVPIARTAPATGRLPSDAMQVGIERTPAVVPGRAAADVLVVHPERVADVVRWSDGGAQPLDDVMAALTEYDGDRVPVVLAGALPDAVTAATDGRLALDFTYYTVPIEVVARVDAFPGQASREPLMVADWDRYAAALDRASRVPELVLAREVWARGDVDAVVESVERSGLTPGDLQDVTTATEFAARPELDAQSWSLDYLRALALAAGVLGLVGVTLHALAQQRRRTAADLLLRRMGLSRRSADIASAIEIGLLTGLAAVVAVAVALPVSAVVLRLLDPVPQLPPEPLFAVPWGSLGAVAAGVLFVTVGGAVLVGRSSRRATGGQILRDAT